MLLNKIAAIAVSVAPLTPPALGHSTDVHDYYPAPKPYRLETCLVSDDKLGDRGKPYVFTHKRQQIKLCCKSCKKEFKQNLKKYLEKLESKSKDKK